jgi:hypothetical protein
MREPCVVLQDSCGLPVAFILFYDESIMTIYVMTKRWNVEGDSRHSAIRHRSSSRRCSAGGFVGKNRAMTTMSVLVFDAPFLT